MFVPFKRSWRMVTSSAAVLRSKPSLLVFPAISAVVLVVVTSAMVFPLLLGLGAAIGLDLSETTVKVLGGVGLFVWYFLCTFVIVFCNAALVFCALQSFNGESPSIGSGLAAAGRRFRQIAGWSAVAATVGVALRALQSVLSKNFGFWGELAQGIADAAWSVTTYFVLPVVVTEGTGPIKAVKRSATILRRTWGESLIGTAGLGAILLLMLLPLFGLGVLLMASADNGPAASVIGIVAIVYAVAIAVVYSVLNTIFRAAVYHYAVTGAAPEQMDPQLLQTAFRAR